jgi:hypothetical protein
MTPNQEGQQEQVLAREEGCVETRKPIYNSKDWVLGECSRCGKLNYVEPHGTTEYCSFCKDSTEHKNIPYGRRDSSGCYLIKLESGVVK